ncbi:MAG TPA: alkaline phosphatase family protein [Verrucomicrobiota bacterium]|nr:alkaline phosphatase family protein [Verrucomicrobiales bacterium]HRI11433.1 alkaline phosphatase family protein [Verrucomicrobiota bacterium]
MQRTAVLNVVGLTRSLIGEHTPRLRAFQQRHPAAVIDPALPAVTCTAQSDYLTGRRPTDHGIVGNGWYHRELAEIQFWKQSNHLVGAPKIWDELRAVIPHFTCAKLFWWYNMYSTADWSVTPRPMYPADGRKLFDIYAWPYDLRPALKQKLGEFPFAGFWGPAAGVKSPQGTPDCATRWIAESAKLVEEWHSPTLNLVYLPHLDYNLQRHGPTLSSSSGGQLNPKIIPDLKAIDDLVGDLLDYFDRRGVQVIVLSEYGITSVDTPIHLNREFRKRGWLTIKEELGLELLDAGNSKVFAVADHQVAHVYVNDRKLMSEVEAVLEATPGVAEIWDFPMKIQNGLAHPRAGDLVVFAQENAWFTYYYWMNDQRAPDFARCVDIHRKPGYDPVELFLDPNIPLAKVRIAWRLLQKRLGFRMLMDVIPLDATLVRGSHGTRPASQDDWPVVIGPGVPLNASLGSTEVAGVIRHALLG